MRRMYVTLPLTFLLLVGCGGQEPAADGASEGSSEATRQAAATQGGETMATSTLPTKTVTIVPSGGEEPVQVKAEIADDEAERQRGLMERTDLAEDAGMLFVFGREQQLSFWMRNTHIPLSIAYIDASGRIVDIEDMEPFDDQTKHPSAEPSKYALEVNQGFFDERGIEVGDTVEIPEDLR